MSKISLIPLAYVCMYCDLLKGFGGFSMRVCWPNAPLNSGGARSYCLIVPLRAALVRGCDGEPAASANLCRRLRSQWTQLIAQLIMGCLNTKSR